MQKHRKVARGQGNIIFPVQLTTSRIGNLTWLIHTLLYVMTIHTCMQEHDRRLCYAKKKAEESRSGMDHKVAYFIFHEHNRLESLTF